MLDTAYAYKFIYLLTKKWEDTKAYKLGIIDKDGNKISEPTTEEQKSAYDKFTILVFNVKRLLEKLPFGKASLSKYAAALYLLKEDYEPNIDIVFINFLKENSISIDDLDNILECDNQYIKNDKYFHIFGINFIKEDSELIMLDENFTTGIDFADKPLKLREDQLFEPDEYHCGDPVFHCSSDVFSKSIRGKTPYVRFKTYLGEDDVGHKIKEYAKKYPNKNIILKNNDLGGMIYFRRK